MLKATLIGNLTNDPELRYSANGQPFLRFTVASNYRTQTPDGEWQDRVEFIRVTVFGQRAEGLSQWLRKGAKVYVDGRLEARPWIDQQGQMRAGLEILANDVEFMNARQPDDDQPIKASVTDERPARWMPEAMALAGARGAVGLADRDDGDLEDVPFQWRVTRT
jgi:single-strand DNA-binding protein